MTIRSNTPLSDAELRRLASAEDIEAELREMFPGLTVRLNDDGSVLLGAPPWDMRQELHREV